MLDEYSKCRFCKSHDNFMGCTNWFCSLYDKFVPDKNKVVEKAKEKGISASDIIALINWEA